MIASQLCMCEIYDFLWLAWSLKKGVLKLACFVVVLLIFNNLSAVFSVNETQGYAISRYEWFTILLITPTQINCHGDYHCHNSRTRIAQNVIILQDLIRWTQMFVWLLVASGEIPECESKNKVLKLTVFNLKYVVLRHWNSCINCWQDHRKSVSAFLRFLVNQLTVSVEL